MTFCILCEVFVPWRENCISLQKTAEPFNLIFIFTLQTNSMAKQAAPIDLSDSFEKIPVKIFSSPKEGAVFVAKQVADFIRDKQTKKESGWMESLLK